MPTYLCRSGPDAITDEQRAELARRFTTVHATATHAPPSFVQVIFEDLLPGRHHIAGRPADPRSVFVHGHIREGRPPEVRTAVALGIRDAVTAVTGLPADVVWVYVSEVPPGQMIEFGHVLPAPGGEQAWTDGLPDGLRAHLRELDANR